MSERERNNFVRFLNVEKSKDNRDDLEIFERLSNEDDSTLAFKDKRAKDAYHQNRKRLMEKLVDYFVLKSRKEDITGNSKIMGLMILSKFLFEGKMNRLGWKIIKKAEKVAWESDQFALLNSIYLLMIENSDGFHSSEIKALIRKKTEAYRLAMLEENVIMATQIIKLKLDEVKRKGTNLNFSVFLETVLNKFKISSIVFENPKHLYNIIQVVRSSYLASRNLKHFEDFALEQYSVLKEKFGFKKQHHQYKIELEYMIAHVLYRNRKYTHATEFLRTMYSSMNEYGKLHYRAFYPKYISILASVKCFTGKISEAIALHENILFKQKYPLSVNDEINLHINLAVFYHWNKQLSKAQHVFKSLHHSDEWTESKMGREFVLRKNLILAMYLYDVHQEEEGLEVLNSILKRYEDLLQMPQYEKVKVYLQILIIYFENPDHPEPKRFVNVIEKNSDKFDFKNEENKTIAFFCWMVAKIKKTDFYKLILATVKS